MVHLHFHFLLLSRTRLDCVYASISFDGWCYPTLPQSRDSRGLPSEARLIRLFLFFEKSLFTVNLAIENAKKKRSWAYPDFVRSLHTVFLFV